MNIQIPLIRKRVRERVIQDKEQIIRKSILFL